MGWKVTVKLADGATAEGELETLPEGAISEEQYSERFQKEIARRTSSIERKARAELLEDDEFKGLALQKWGIDLAKLQQAGELNKEKVDQLREEIRRGEVGPLQEQLTTAQARIKRKLLKELESEILRVASPLVKPELLKTFGAGSRPAVVAATLDLFGHDEETDTWYRKGQKDGEFAFSRSGKTPYQTVEEAFHSLAEDPDYKDLFLDKRPSGPGFGDQRKGSQLHEELEKLPPEERLAVARERGLTK